MTTIRNGGSTMDWSALMNLEFDSSFFLIVQFKATITYVTTGVLIECALLMCQSAMASAEAEGVLK